MGAQRIAQRLSHLFDETVTIAPWTGQDVYGQPSYGTGVSYRARIMRGVAHGGGADQALPTMHKIIIGEGVRVDVRDQVLLPEDYGSRDDAGDFARPSVTITEINYLNDSRGTVATVLYCGRANA